MIECTHIRKAYGSHVILNDYSLRIERGERCALSAPSGSGKTTMLRLLAGLEAPDAGELHTEGRVSMLFQEDRLLDALDAVRNIRFACPDADIGEIEALQLGMGLTQEELHMPVGRFSGGMRRRTAIARALLYPADILLLDEPYKGLDDETRERVIECAKPYLTGKTVIIASHDARDYEGMRMIAFG